MARDTVFISYAREDARYAERLYKDLRVAGVDAWLDTKRLLPGQDWELEISQAIREASFFIALISERALSKRGFVQSEMKKALKVLDEVPSGQAFLIQVRLDGTQPRDERLRALNWVDLLPDYERGFERILSTLQELSPVPLEIRGSGIGARAPISYTPYRTFSDFAHDLIEKLPSSASLADADYSMFVTYRTAAPGVVMPERLRAQYPDEIKIVLQHQFDALTAHREHFTVVLWFGGSPSTLAIPYDAIREIVVPKIGLRLEHF